MKPHQPSRSSAPPSALGKGADARLKTLLSGLKKPLLVSGPANLRWLTGFTGSYGYLLLLPPGRCFFLTDGRYTEQAAAEVPVGCPVRLIGDSLGRTLQKAELLGKGEMLTVEAEHFTMATFRRLETEVGPGLLEAVPSPVPPLRARKDRAEVARIENALRLTEEAMVWAASVLAPGMREEELAARLAFYCRQKGASGMSFDTIIASGPRGALPHGVASPKPIGVDEPVLFDFGVLMDGYCSDFTRVVHTGTRIPTRLARIHAVVCEALEAGKAVIRPGIETAAVDEAARQVFRKHRLLPRYTHSLGHGVGLEIHEAPRLSVRSREVLEEGMVVTVEPGLYISGSFGVRLEDMVLVTSRGCRTLTAFPLEIACLGRRPPY